MVRFAVLLATLLLAAPAGAAPASAPAGAPPAGAPRLLVLLTVDQLRGDYPQLYGRQWTRGLATLFAKGAHYRQARYPYLQTVTCAGHATIGTGTFPHRHGMVLNAWWDLRLGRGLACTEDPAAPIVLERAGARPLAAGGQSARNLAVPSFAEVLKQRFRPAPRVVSFSTKARSAIVPVGKAGDLVVWYEGQGAWATSRAFARGPNPLVERVLAPFTLDRLTARPWTPSLPAARYLHRDDDPAERPPLPFWTTTFPHPLAVPPAGAAGPAPSPWAGWERSPFPDEALLALAAGALEEMALGQGTGIDILAVSFSALDSVGHAFGPRSHEVQDTLVRLDRLLGRLLGLLDRRVGRGRYLLALTADHGVAEIPEGLTAQGQEGGRVDLGALQKRLEEAIAGELGAGSHVPAINYTDVYLTPGVLERLAARPGALERVRRVVRSHPGVAAVFSADQIADPARATDPWMKAAALGYFPGRSGQLILVPRANWLTASAGTTHGTLHRYDQWVPIVLYGAGVRAGVHDRAVTPADVVVTLAAAVGVTLPGAEGTPLHEALAPPTRRDP